MGNLHRRYYKLGGRFFGFFFPSFSLFPVAFETFILLWIKWMKERFLRQKHLVQILRSLYCKVLQCCYRPIWRECRLLLTFCCSVSERKLTSQKGANLKQMQWDFSWLLPQPFCSIKCYLRPRGQFCCHTCGWNWCKGPCSHNLAWTNGINRILV